MRIYASGEHTFNTGVGSVILDLEENDEIYVKVTYQSFFNMFYNIFTGYML